MYTDYLEKKQYENFFDTIPIRNKFQCFYDLHEEIYRNSGEKVYYSILGQMLIETEFHYDVRHIIGDFIYFGDDPLKMMRPEERKVFDTLPDKFVVYRGVCSESRILLRDVYEFLGYSWSINKEKSLWFSRRFDKKFKYLFTTEVDKEDIFSYFNRRKEEEIFLEYDSLDLSKIKVERIK